MHFLISKVVVVQYAIKYARLEEDLTLITITSAAQEVRTRQHAVCVLGRCCV